MAEQPPNEKQREREEGRPDPEELLRRYGLRDSDLEVPPGRCRARYRRQGRTAADNRWLRAPARAAAHLPGRGGRRG